MSYTPNIPPKRRLPKVFALTQRAVDELLQSLPDESESSFEFVVVYRSNGAIDFLAAPGDELLQEDCNGRFCLHSVPTEDPGHFILKEVEKCEVESGAEIIEDLTTRTPKRVTTDNFVAFSTLSSSGCACSGGGCTYKR
jgi:hypothetical protein